jgi:hypothetical protein
MPWRRAVTGRPSAFYLVGSGLQSAVAVAESAGSTKVIEILARFCVGLGNAPTQHADEPPRFYPVITALGAPAIRTEKDYPSRAEHLFKPQPLAFAGK